MMIDDWFVEVIEPGTKMRGQLKLADLKKQIIHDLIDELNRKIIDPPSGEGNGEND